MCYYPSMGVMSTTKGQLFALSKAMREFMAQPGDGLTKICIKSIMSQLLCIQNTIRDWLHRRKTPPRHEAALFLQARLPCELVDMVVWALHF